jgi:hypothetical protein
MEKEAPMKRIFRINFIFWKEGPLLFDVAPIVPALLRESRLPRLGALPPDYS